MKDRRLIAWISGIIPLLITLIVLTMLPDRIPAHYGFDGAVTRFGSKYEMLILPIITILWGFFWVLMIKIARKDKEKSKQSETVLFWTDLATTWLFTIMQLWFLYNSYIQAENIYVSDFDFMRVVAVAASLLYIVIGNVLPKCKQNYWIGIRTKWTLASEDNWYRTHRFGGKVFVAGGILSAVLCAIFGGVAALAISLGGLLILVVPIVVYSYRIYRY